MQHTQTGSCRTERIGAGDKIWDEMDFFPLYFPLLQGMVISRTSSVVLSNISRNGGRLRGGGKSWPPQFHSHFSFSHLALGTS